MDLGLFGLYKAFFRLLSMELEHFWSVFGVLGMNFGYFEINLGILGINLGHFWTIFWVLGMIFAYFGPSGHGCGLMSG